MRKSKRHLRYLILLLILLGVAGHNLFVYLKVRSWQEPLIVRIYPVNGDGSVTADRYIESLTITDFIPIETFINTSASSFGVEITNAIHIELSGLLSSLPRPAPQQHSIWRNILWSLHFRGWANIQLFSQPQERPDVALYVSFFDPQTSPALRHSVGLKGSMLALINAFADNEYSGSNNVVITHELLHTFGATDKYAGKDHLPQYPNGFAEPDKIPLYPQRRAEIMAGRIPITEDRAVIPTHLDQVVIGLASATEINWPR